MRFGRPFIAVLAFAVMVLAVAGSTRLGRAEDILHVGIVNRDWQFFKDTGQISGKVTVDQIVDLASVKTAAAKLGSSRHAEPDARSQLPNTRIMDDDPE